MLKKERKNVGRGFINQAQNLNTGFIKQILYNFSNIFCLMLFIDAIKHNVEKKKDIKVNIQNFFYTLTYVLMDNFCPCF